MKRFSKMISLLSAGALFILSFCTVKLPVSAAEATTYYVMYLSEENDWRFQTGSTWDDTAQYRELYYMNQVIQDGDIVIVQGKGSTPELKIPAKLSNLTIVQSDFVSVTADSIDECFVTTNCVAAINGNVTNAYVYDRSRCTFNNNVSYLQTISENDFYATVTVMGTVDHLKGTNGGRVYYEWYSFPAGKLAIEEGYVVTDAAYYSAAPSASTQAAAPTAAPSATGTPAAPSVTDSGDLDDVPKTGDVTSNAWVYLVGIACLCLGGRTLLKKK